LSKTFRTTVKIKFHYLLEGKPESLQVLLNVDQWYAVYAYEVPEDALSETGNSVGEHGYSVVCHHFRQ